MSVRYNTIRDYLETIYGGYDRDGWVTFWQRTNRFQNDPGLNFAFKVSDLDQMARRIEKSSELFDTYVVTGLLAEQPTAGKRGAVKDFVSVSHFTLDLDVRGPNHSASHYPATVDEALALLEGLPAPSLILHTGGGLSVQIFFNQPYSTTETNVAQVMKAVEAHVQRNAAARGLKIDTTAQVNRIHRLPGTYNRKRGDKVAVVQIGGNGARYPLSAFEQFLPLVERPKRTPQPRRERAVSGEQAEVDFELPLEKACELLEAIPCDELEYHDWLGVLYALHTTYGEDTALELALDWVAEGARERNGLIEVKFASFADKEYGWNPGTLVRLAREFGWAGTLRTGKGRQESVEDDNDVLGLVPNAKRVNQRYLDIELPSTKAVVVRSAMGTGKTVWLSKLTRSYEGAVINLAHRVALLKSLSERLALDFYLSQPAAAIAKSDRLAITLESLHKIDRERRYGLLIIDEVEQVLHHLVSSDTTKQSRREILEYIRFLIARAEKVVVTDADAGSLAVEFLKLFLPEHDITVVVNTYRKPGERVLRYESEDALLAAMVERFKAGKKLYVAVNSTKRPVTYAQLLREAVPGSQVMHINGENSGDAEVQDFVAAINDRVQELDALVVSPSLGTGVSIDAEHFDEVFLVGFGNVNTHRDLAQALSRVRSPRGGIIHSWVSPLSAGKEENAERLRQWAITNYRETETLVKFDDETGEAIALEPTYLRLWSLVTSARHRSLNALAVSFYAQMETIGHSVEDAPKADEDAVRAVKAAYKEARDAGSAASAAAIVSARLLNDLEYLEAKEKRVLTEAERASFQKTRLTRTYGVAPEEVTAALVQADDDGLYTQMTNLAALLDPEYAQRADQREAKVHAADRRLFTLTSELRAEILRLGGVDLSRPGERITPTEGFSCWAEQNAERIQRVLGVKVGGDIRTSPLKLVGKVLAQLGLALETRRQGGGPERGSKYKVLNAERLAEMRRYADYHVKDTAPRPLLLPLKSAARESSLMLAPF